MALSLILMNIYKRKSLHPLSDNTIDTPIDTHFFYNSLPPDLSNLSLSKENILGLGRWAQCDVGVLEIFGQVRLAVLSCRHGERCAKRHDIFTVQCFNVSASIPIQFLHRLLLTATHPKCIFCFSRCYKCCQLFYNNLYIHPLVWSLPISCKLSRLRYCCSNYLSTKAETKVETNFGNFQTSQFTPR